VADDPADCRSADRAEGTAAGKRAPAAPPMAAPPRVFLSVVVMPAHADKANRLAIARLILNLRISVSLNL
jgi:hypothetical protein